MTTHDEGNLPARADVRASDADRESVVELLREHCAAGRLSAEELDERLGEAYAARTLAELGVALRELPDRPSRAQPERPRRARPRPPLRAALVAVAALVVAIAVASDGEGLWLLWPLGFLLVKSGRWDRRRRHAGHGDGRGGASAPAPGARAVG